MDSVQFGFSMLVATGLSELGEPMRVVQKLSNMAIGIMEQVNADDITRWLEDTTYINLTYVSQTAEKYARQHADRPTASVHFTSHFELPFEDGCESKLAFVSRFLPAARSESGELELLVAVLDLEEVDSYIASFA